MYVGGKALQVKHPARAKTRQSTVFSRFSAQEGDQGGQRAHGRKFMVKRELEIWAFNFALFGKQYRKSFEVSGVRRDIS